MFSHLLLKCKNIYLRLYIVNVWCITFFRSSCKFIGFFWCGGQSFVCFRHFQVSLLHNRDMHAWRLWCLSKIFQLLPAFLPTILNWLLTCEATLSDWARWSCSVSEAFVVCVLSSDESFKCCESTRCERRDRCAYQNISIIIRIFSLHSEIQFDNLPEIPNYNILRAGGLWIGIGV